MSASNLRASQPTLNMGGEVLRVSSVSIGPSLHRVRFFPRQPVTAADFSLEQQYAAEKRRRHNRFLHGWGIVSGCLVEAAPTDDLPLQVAIYPGYALSPQGDEIFIPQRALFDVASCLATSDDPCAYSRPCPPDELVLDEKNEVLVRWLAVRYVECQARPVRVAPAGCGCDDAACEYSRIQDAYEFACLSELPATYKATGPNCDQLCAGEPRDLPGEDDPWVVLAAVRLRPKTRDRAKPGLSVLLPDRLELYSTANLQTMAICQCTPGYRLKEDTPVVSEDNKPKRARARKQ